MAEDILKADLDEEGIEPEKEMTFLEHLEELRWRIIYSLIGIVVGTIVAWIFIDFLVDVVLLKACKRFRCNTSKLKTIRTVISLYANCNYGRDDN